MGKFIEEDLDSIMKDMQDWREQVEEYEREAAKEEARIVYGSIKESYR